MVTFEIIESAKKKKDIEKAIDIYLSAIDIETSYTNTNQIKEHIFSTIKDENREMFFYNLYMDNELFGFAEFGYLPKTEVLIIDYICTKKRNPYAFYTFYNLCCENITLKLAKHNMHYKYIITEISLVQVNGLYCDVDSNYFRKMLSIENFVLLKYPYYQPTFCGQQLNFAIAIKSTSNSSANTSLNEVEYLEIIEDLYLHHYATWYKKYISPDEVDKIINKLYSKIKKVISPQTSSNSISLVNCPIFEAGKCRNVDIEPITISKKIKHSLLKTLLIMFWFIASIACCFFVAFNDDSLVNKIVVAISCISGLITILLYIRDLLRN